MAKDAEPIQPPAVNKEKSGPEPIIIPIILKMAEFDHKVSKVTYGFDGFPCYCNECLLEIAQKITPIL